jgi:hypothetical protein
MVSSRRSTKVVSAKVVSKRKSTPSSRKSNPSDPNKTSRGYIKDIAKINDVAVFEYDDGLKHVSDWHNYKLSHRVEFINNPNAKDPSWKKLDHFLSTNVLWNIEKDVYKLYEFMCGDHALTLHNNAEAAGIHCGVVYIDTKGNGSRSGHALTVFNTTDYGWTFVDPVFRMILSKKNFFAQGRDYTIDYAHPENGLARSRAMAYLKDHYFHDGLRYVEIIW